MSTDRTGSTEVEDRRQRAREAAQDRLAGARYGGVTMDEESAIDIAVEAATRVQITPGLIVAARNVWSSIPAEGMRVLLRTAFEAAGFEVVE